MHLSVSGNSQAEDVASDCRHAVLSLADLPAPLAVSLGVATLMPCDAQEQHTSMDSALQAVETALAAAREAGDNSCRTVTL